LTDQDIEQLEKSIREEVEQSLRFAEESPLPAPEELYTDVYANPIPIAAGKADPKAEKN